MRSRTLERILRKHDVDVGYWPEMRSLVSDGERPSMELVYALNHVGNCMAANLDPNRIVEEMQIQVSAEGLETLSPQGSQGALADNANQSATASSAKGGKSFSPWPILFGRMLRLALPSLAASGRRIEVKGEQSSARSIGNAHAPRNLSPCPGCALPPAMRQRTSAWWQERGYCRRACDHCAESRVGRVRIYGLPQGRQKKIWAALSTVRALRRIGLTRQTRKTPSSSLPCIVPVVLGSASPAEQNTHHSTRQRPASILTHARGSSGVNRTVPQWTLPWLFWNVPVSVPLFP